MADAEQGAMIALTKKEILALLCDRESLDNYIDKNSARRKLRIALKGVTNELL